MSEKKNVKKIIRRRIKTLTCNPLQNAIICDIDEAALQRLAEDLDANGQITPVEITPNNVIIDGHQRVKAAQRLGWEKIKVWVRSDLTDDISVSKRFLEANVNRRQMGKLETARVFTAMKKLRVRERIAKRTKGDNLSAAIEKDEKDLRDRLSKLFGCSGRTLDRYSRLLATPIEIQRAFEAGSLTQKEAEGVANCSLPKQEQMALEIRGGADPRRVVTAHAAQTKRTADPQKSQRKALASLMRTTAELGQNQAAAKKCLTKEHLRGLKDAKRVLHGLIKYIEDHPDECKTSEEAIAEAATALRDIAHTESGLQIRTKCPGGKRALADGMQRHACLAADRNHD